MKSELTGPNSSIEYAVVGIDDGSMQINQAGGRSRPRTCEPPFNRWSSPCVSCASVSRYVASEGSMTRPPRRIPTLFSERTY